MFFLKNGLTLYQRLSTSSLYPWQLINNFKRQISLKEVPVGHEGKERDQAFVKIRISKDYFRDLKETKRMVV